jgi:hypothetical protein
MEAAQFDLSTVQQFQTVLLTDFIPQRFHVNSYIQESLVDLYKATVEITVAANMHMDGIESQCQEQAETLFERLLRFRFRLKSSLQEGHIRWGFLKKRKLVHWDIMSFFFYIRSLFYFRKNIPPKSGRAPVEIETRFLASQLYVLSQQWSTSNTGLTPNFLRREFLDLETCYWAHRESYVASTVFVMAFFVFCSSILFSFGRVFGLDGLEDAAFWAAVPSTFGAILASFHLLRKHKILKGLLYKLRNKFVTERATNDVSRADYTIVLQATRHQVFLTLTRLFTAVTAAFVLPFAIVVMMLQNQGDDENDDQDSSTLLPSWLASISVMMGTFSLIYFFYVEYVVRYNLPVDLGPFVGRIFSEEIEATYLALDAPWNGIDSAVKEDRIRWEYTAKDFLHHYRFDTVFAADRFGQILQTIQGGQLLDQKQTSANEGDASSYMV